MTPSSPTPHNFYKLDVSDPNSITLTSTDIIHGNNRAQYFLGALSKALQGRDFKLDKNVSLDALDKAVTDIQHHVESRKFYTVMSWIPFTGANSVSKLITQVKREIAEKKIDAAKNNTTNCEEYFVPSDNLIQLINISDKDIYKHLVKPNQHMLFYEKGIIHPVNTPLANRWKSMKLVLFVVEYDPLLGVMKIMDPNPHDPSEKYYKSANGLVNFQKQEIFDKLKYY